MKKPKLPKVWVLLTPRVDPRDGYRLDSCMQDRAPLAAAWREWQSLHRYVPSTKPKVCRWKLNADGSWGSGCGINFQTSDEFCPRCSGKIKVAK